MEMPCMLAFVLLGACGCLGNLESSQSIYVAQMNPAVPTAGPVESFGSSGEVGAADRFVMPRQGGLVVIAPPVTAGGSQVTRAPDGLFYVTAIVNGAPVRFLIDTGASMIVLRPDDARRAGVLAGDEAFSQTADTAGGKTAMAKVTLDEVVVGGTRQKALAAAVVRSDLPVSLLGQNWVAQLASLTFSGDRMLFN
jgi:aspartyl protease family protein